MENSGAELLFFYGDGCPHCKKMEAHLDQLDGEGLSVTRLEVWNDEGNAKRLEECDPESDCGGVPFFLNTSTGKTICGEASLEEIKSWAKGE